MFDSKHRFAIFFQLSLIVISVRCNDSANDNNVAKIDMFSIMNVNISNIANEILNQDWTENLDCLSELLEIQNGLKNSEKWSMKSGLRYL